MPAMVVVDYGPDLRFKRGFRWGPCAELGRKSQVRLWSDQRTTILKFWVLYSWRQRFGAVLSAKVLHLKTEIQYAVYINDSRDLLPPNARLSYSGAVPERNTDRAEREQRERA